MTSTETLTAVDLFSGAGGLSLGARRAGFKIEVAVEINGDVIDTYRANHPNTVVLERDLRVVRGADLTRESGTRHIDLLMGCAPCQGFCSLTSKHQRVDPRNELVSEMARLVLETLPDAVVMENVPGLAHRGRVLLDDFLAKLKGAGYKAQWWNVQMADYGVPQRRRRLVLLAGRGFEIPLPPPTHARCPADAGVAPWRTLRDAIYGSRAPIRLSAARKRGGPGRANWHVVRDLRNATKARLKAAEAGGMRQNLDASILPACHRDGYEGFRNVYMRMPWDAPAPTITSGCTTPAKGRFGHPDRRRSTISVREAATLQTFPKSFRLVTDRIEVACEMVGNAVPPMFAEKVAVAVRDAIAAHRRP